MNKIFNKHNSTLNIQIDDYIGFWGISDKDVKDQLEGHDGDVHLNIASYGGETNQAFKIYNLLKSHNGRVTAHFYGDSASSATLIGMAADKTTAVDNIFYLIHNVWGVFVGNVHDMEEAIKELKQEDKRLVDVYKKKTGLSENEIMSMMEEEAWWTAEEAKDNGFIDEVVEPEQTMNRTKNSIMATIKPENKNVINQLFNKIEKMDKKNKDEVADSVFNRVMKEIKNKAKDLVGDGKVLDEASEAKVKEMCNEVAETISNEATENETTLAEAHEKLEKENKDLNTTNANLEKDLEAEKAKNSTNVIDPKPKEDVILDEDVPKDNWDKVADKIKNYNVI